MNGSAGVGRTLEEKVEVENENEEEEPCGEGVGAAEGSAGGAASNVILGVSSLGRVRFKKRTWEQVE